MVPNSRSPFATNLQLLALLLLAIMMSSSSSSALIIVRRVAALCGTCQSGRFPSTSCLSRRSSLRHGVTIFPRQTTTRLYAAVDDQGRIIRRTIKEQDDDSANGWENFDPTQPPLQGSEAPAVRRTEERQQQQSGNPWITDDIDSSVDDRRRTVGPPPPSQRRYNNNNNSYSNMGGRSRERREDDRYSRDNRRNNYRDDRFDRAGPRRDFDNRDNRRNNNQGERFDRGGPRRDFNNKDSEERRMNLKELEKAGFDHLYGLSSVLNALETGKRDFRRPEDDMDLDTLSPDERAHELQQRARKPEAQFSPWLLVQERKEGGGPTTTRRAGDKVAQATRVMKLAEERGIPIATVDKGVLNVLSDNRPHQGFVLRCGRLVIDDISRLALPSDDPTAPAFWLVLDEVVDPQNFGALVRSAYFLGHDMGILTCRKNSAPPSPVTSAASAGTLERAPIFSTNNLPKTLAQAEQDGFRIVGAATSVPADAVDVPIYDLPDLPVDDEHDRRPTLLVLGSEGHGLRSLVARSCTEFVRIPSANTEGVDSLNVSVTGGILLWHFLSQQMKRR